MFCPKCGSEIAEGSAFCGKCGASVGAQAGGVTPAGSAQGAASGGAGAGAPVPKRNGAKIGAIAAVAVVAVVLVAGFATNWFGLAGVQPKEAVEVPAASQGADEAQDANAADGQSADANESAGDAQDGSQDADGAAVKSAVEAYTWDELSQISAEIGAAGDEAAAIEVAKKYNLCTPEGKLDGTQVKSVTLADGTQTTVQIVGFAHDDKTAGGKAGITFIFGDCIDLVDMDAGNTSVGGWEASSARSRLSSAGVALLPDDLASVIVPVDKFTNNVGETEDTASVTTTSDSLWLFSMKELGAVENDQIHDEESSSRAILDKEGATYKLIMDLRSDSGDENDWSVLARDDGDGGYWYWWGRSPNPYRGPNEYGFTPSVNHYFMLVSYNGRPSFSTEANGQLGVVPGFCI
ncbi:DUF6273 domain-containing protein [Adlercreutzia equolifaciens]|uniref:DUF6273 domain-containing protein n=1 Tax=Adlercreutzia equolifaciens TaxID=446660 RepID=UPI0022E51AB4|nr:DUF6273 domain-containing protein [Adlercreutzia equolifaciens]